MQSIAEVSIADATLASSQPIALRAATYCGLPFQSQTRRLLPRNASGGFAIGVEGEFQSQTRRLLPRNAIEPVDRMIAHNGFNRRRDACFLATWVYQQWQS